MGKLFRRLLLGAGIVWGVKALQDKRREWSTRPATDIRRDVMAKLPDSMDQQSRERVCDKLVEAGKGPGASRSEWKPAGAGTTTPPPGTPLSGSGTTPPPPPPADTTRTGGSTTPVPPVSEIEEGGDNPNSPPPH